jgi:hypothetical protein
LMTQSEHRLDDVRSEFRVFRHHLRPETTFAADSPERAPMERLRLAQNCTVHQRTRIVRLRQMFLVSRATPSHLTPHPGHRTGRQASWQIASIHAGVADTTPIRIEPQSWAPFPPHDHTSSLVAVSGDTGLGEHYRTSRRDGRVLPSGRTAEEGSDDAGGPGSLRPRS